MGICSGILPDKVFKVGALQITRYDFAFCIRSKRSRIADFAAEFYTRYGGFHIVRVRQDIGINLERVDRIGSVRRICPQLFGRRTVPSSVQELAGGLNLTA